jgi:hypothetical protein
VFKIRFEFVPYTGIWWDETMENAGTCEGVLKLFLLQSKLSPQITHYEFFDRLMRPYLMHTNNSDRVYGGPSSPSIHKDAWSSCVLDKLKMFEFCSKPGEDMQGAMAGIDVNICMRLTHYVLLQGLGITHDWNQKMHENSSFVSCVHLRNMSSLALGCISLLLHTCVDKAMIPANGGQLRLPLTSPVFECKQEAQVLYDSRLHIDTHQHSMGGRSDNMICVSARMANSSNWAVLELACGQAALWYAPVLCDNARMSQAQSRANLFPFPPEAVAHTSFMFDDMFLANRRHMEMIEKDMDDELHSSSFGSVLAEAMLLLGESIRLEDFQHKQPSLTDCAIRDGREVPCVTCQHGFLFTLSFREGILHLNACSRTHHWATLAEAKAEAKEHMPFQSLPLVSEQADGVSMCSTNFYHVFRHGLCVELTDDATIEVKVDIAYKEQTKRLPFYFFPVMHCPVLVVLEHSGWFRHEGGLLLHTVDYFHSKYYSDCHVRDIGDEWFAHNDPAACTLFAECQAMVPGVCIQACFKCEKSTTPVGFWATHDETMVYFMSQEHIRQDLATNSFMDTSMFVPHDGAGPSRECYLMVESKYGLAAVRYAESAKGEALIVDFSSFHNNTKTEIKECFSMAFEHFKPRLLPAGEDSCMWPNKQLTMKITDRVWGMVVENTAGTFLHDGAYTISSMAARPCAQESQNVMLNMDFISMSRCMLVEGGEVWINITAPIYDMIQQQAQEQGFRIMLPVTMQLHENMQGPRYLRGFYVLGGSLHDATIDNNCVRIICVIANKLRSADNDAELDSAVNYNANTRDIRFVAISLPVLDTNGACIITCERNDGVPVYKYLMERSLVRV